MHTPQLARAVVVAVPCWLAACNGAGKASSTSPTTSAELTGSATSTASAEARTAGDAGPREAPNKADVLATMKRLGYEGARFGSVGDCGTVNGESADHHQATLLIKPCNHEQEAPGWATFTAKDNIVVAALVTKDGKPDGDATQRLLAGAAEGAGKTARPIELKPAPPPAWHLTRFKTADDLKAILTAQGFEDVHVQSNMASGDAGSARALAHDHGKWIELFVMCSPEGFDVPWPFDEPGRAYYRDGRCHMKATVLTKEPTLEEGDTGEPLPNDARKVLEAALAWK